MRTKVVPGFSRTVIAGLALALTVSSSAAPAQGQDKDLRLIEAVRRRDQKAVSSLIRSKADLNATQPDGATALAWAVHLGQRSMAHALLDAGAGSVDAVRQLVLHGADVNGADPRRGQNALMWAAAEGHADVVGALLEIGADPTAASRTGFTALVFAVTRDDVESIDTLITAGADPNYTLPSGNKPLLIAQAYRHTAATLALLERGADITVRDRAGNTPIHLAAQAGNVAVVNALLARGADPNVRTPRSTPAAARGGGGGFRGGPGGEQTPLLMAARGDHLQTMQVLVAGGADPLLSAQDGTSLLMSAAAGGRIETVKYAYELDPNVHVVTSPSGNTIMHVAVGLAGRTQPEVVEVMQFLADRGAKLDEMNAANRTPISLADGLPVDLAVDLLTKLITESGSTPKIPSKR